MRSINSQGTVVRLTVALVQRRNETPEELPAPGENTAHAPDPDRQPAE